MSDLKFDIRVILEELRNVRCYYSSERDFQLALAMQIEKEYGVGSVICEYSPEYHSKVGENYSRIHIDIVFCEENIPIEIKYRTKKACLESHTSQALKIYLTNQNAHDEGCYGFWKDVCRINEYKEIKNAPMGYVIFLTNDIWYKEPDYTSCRVDYTEYNLNETSRYNRGGIVSNKRKMLENVPKIESEWIEWDKDNDFWCYIAKI